MHSIERYGIVALLFLVVTVVAVLMWDGGAQKEKSKEVAAREPAPAAPARAERPRRGDPARRLSLLVEGREGPPPSPLPSTVEAQGTVEAPAANDTSLAEPPEVDSPATLRSEEAEGVPESSPSTPPAKKGTTAPVTSSTSLPSYSVRPGDTLSEIAQRTLGSSRRWPEIVAVNPGLDPSRLRSGTSIKLPAGSAALGSDKSGSAKPASTTPATQTRTWKVGPGESLWRIAERALGDGNRWKEIASLNPGVSADRLVLGTVLKLPAAPGGAKPAAPPAGKKDKAPLLASATAPAKTARGGKVK